jgi:isocitrate dehydrogenase kinase/phosphatase
MERTDWLDKGFDARDARFLMVTAISHHRFRSPMWDEEEILRLEAELAEIDRAAEQAVTGEPTR